MSPAEPVTFTLDLEDHRPSPDAPEGAIPALTREVLDFLDARDVRGTFFVVGEIAEAHPDLVREVAARGHEIGLHGWRHAPLTELDAPTTSAPTSPAARRCSRSSPARPVARVPGADVLAGARVALGASTCSPRPASPTRRACSRPAARCSATRRLPATPFRWPNGLVELPCPVVRVGGVGLPYLGGVYLRAHPRVVGRRRLAAASARAQLLWIYCHPYDFDPDEAFWVVPDAGRLGQPAALVQPAPHVRQDRGACCGAAPARRWPSASTRSPPDAHV